MTAQLVAVRDLANQIAGADIPFLMNFLYGRILEDDERARLREATSALLVNRYPWLKEVQDRGWAPDSPTLWEWTNRMVPIHGLTIGVEPLMTPRKAADTRVIMDPDTASRKPPYAH